MSTDEKDEPSTLPVEPPENDSTEPTNEKKAVVVTPLSKTGYKHSHDQYSSSEQGLRRKNNSQFPPKSNERRELSKT